MTALSCCSSVNDVALKEALDVIVPPATSARIADSNECSSFRFVEGRTFAHSVGRRMREWWRMGRVIAQGATGAHPCEPPHQARPPRSQRSGLDGRRVPQLLERAADIVDEGLDA